MKMRVLLLMVVLALVGIGVWISHGVVQSVFGNEYELFRSIKIGMSEEEVREILGEPYRVYSRGAAPADYYEEGYSFERRLITNKVFIYIATEPIAYVYFDESNRVEEVFVGGS